MPIDELNGATQYVMDLLGIFSFALSGAFIAVRRDFDVFGTVILSEAAGLGGGLFRDLVLQVPPAAFTDLGYYFTPVGAAAVVHFGHRLHDDLLVRKSVIFDVSDAGALGLFSVTGTIKALTHGFNVPAAVTLGAASAVGGGVLASVLAMEVPSLLRWDNDLYALPAVAGAGSTAVLHLTGVLHVGTAVGASVFAITLRLLALRYGWRTPRSHFWRNPFSGMRHQQAVVPARSAAPVPLEADTVTLSPLDARTVTIRRGDLTRGAAPPARDPRIGWHAPSLPHTGPEEAGDEPRRR
ncbi:putative membrane protein YeiH [Streptomyces sp. B3I7]|uniref:trimeric intracellular cation channel family protein n=1 Tax=Streptomyces sp. B3I7 TaxID=3042269 RepID=UPI00278A11E8|nr:trimeric intracellular cation channel family protein [Streptomyces sp. B3I7]MDQ0808988.1 putative membrane protein YeiH [Streptomyces sp. B3I7]